MTKLALHIAHFKKGQVDGIGRHNWEKRGKKDMHSNQDIDVNKSHLNVQLIRQSASLFESVKRDIEDRCTSRVNSRSNWLTEAIVYPPEGLSREEIIEYFKDVVGWFASRYTLENIKSAVIHFDETTPHLHLDMVPLTKTGKLSTKEIFTRSELQKMHSKLAKYLKDCGWEIERGDDTSERDVKALSVIEYKKQKDAEVEELNTEVSRLNEEVSELHERIKKLTSEIDDLKESYEAQIAVFTNDVYPHIDECQDFLNDLQERLKRAEEYASKEYLAEMEFIRKESRDLQDKLSVTSSKLGSSKGVIEKDFGGRS